MIVRRWTGSSTGLLEKQMSRWDTDVGPSVLVPVLEISLIVPEKVVDQSILETETGLHEDGGVISSFTGNSEDEVEGVEAPIHIIDLDEYEMVEFEDETNATTWEDYLILPDSPNSTLP